uniref:O-antigen ligase family protein n=1 Tax=Pseudoalteromonas sp. TaxID=53249 RepID=UPI003562319B
NYLNLCLAMGIGLLISQMKINKHPLPIKQLIIDILESLLSNKIILRLCLIIIVCGLVLTKSRMGNIAFFSALAIISLYGFFFYKNKPQQLKLLIVSFFVLDLVIVGGLIGIGEVKDRLSNTSFVEETRDEVYRDSILIILDKPILGSGGGSFYTAFPAYQSEVILGHYDNAHNDYIQFAAELGLPVSILLGCLLIYLLFLCLNIISTSNCNFQKGIAFGCITSILMMLIHSTVDYSLQSGANSITFIAILATLLNVSKLKSDVKKRRRQ